MKRMSCLILAVLLIILAFPVNAMAAKESISLGGKIGFMYENTSVTLKPKLKNLSSDELVWSSSDISVASVEDGIIRAKKAGRTVIAAAGGSAKAYCGVVVLPKTIELKAGESCSLPYGTVEKYAVQNNSVAQISRSGKITAKEAGTTWIRVRYGKQTLYIQIMVKGDGAQVKQSAAAGLNCANDTNQIILVDYQSGSKAELSIHEKNNGLWEELYSCSAHVGKNGVGKTREGDRRTPSGTFNLTQPFGIKADPGANMPYTKVTQYHYWCGSSGSKYYNQLIDTRKTDRACTSSDEYLINYKGEYNYCMFIDYNASGEAGKGSCIFLHCTGKKEYTAGCIAVPEEVMIKIIQWAKPGVKIVIR